MKCGEGIRTEGRIRGGQAKEANGREKGLARVKGRRAKWGKRVAEAAQLKAGGRSHCSGGASRRRQGGIGGGAAIVGGGDGGGGVERGADGRGAGQEEAEGQGKRKR